MGKSFITPSFLCMRQNSPLERLIADIFEPSRNGFPTEGLFCRDHCDATRPRKFCMQNKRPLTRRPWFAAVNIGHFHPSEISVKVEECQVIINAKREERKVDDFDLVERRRIIKLPEGIDTGKVAYLMGGDGRLLIRAPYLDPEAQQCCCERNISAEQDLDQTAAIKLGCRPVHITVGGKPEKELSPEMSEATQEGSQLPQNIKSNVNTEASPPCKDGDNDTVACTDTEAVVPPLKSLAKESCQSAPLKNVFEQPASSTKGLIIPNGDDMSQTGEDLKVQRINAGSNNNLHELNKLEDLVRRTDDGLHKRFEVSMNLEGFDPENVSIKLMDNELCIDAKQEVTEDGMHSVRGIHRRYTVPDDGVLDAARAEVNANGVVSVIVPLESHQNNARSTPIVQLGELGE